MRECLERLILVSAGWLALCAGGCSAGKDDGPDIVGASGDGATGTAGSDGLVGAGANSGTFFPDDGASGGTEGLPGTLVVNPCTALGCGPGQRCETAEAGVVCADNRCEDLACAATEACRADARGGNICVNLFCERDVDCVVDDFCSEGTCRPDLCPAGETHCEGAGVSICASNGGGAEVPYSCGSASYFDSVCTAPLSGIAACSCEDDWDCPAFTICEVGRCVGTGFAPTCTLAPSDFRETAPAVEIHWGGDSTNDDAAHDGSGDGRPAPWPASSHVQATPMVANLDDDNGDGLINELDLPEIIFVTYTAFQDDSTGVLRAIHGGGPNRGRDYFAVCNGTQVWVEGDPLPPATSCNGGDGRSRSPAAVADLTGDGVPEIVQVTLNNGFRILDNTGRALIDRPNQRAFTGNGLSPSPSIANLDFQGLPELIFGSTVFTLGLNAAGQLFVSAQLDAPAGTNGENDSAGPMSCIADLSPSPGQEILAGPTLYRLPATLPTCAAPPCLGALQVVWSGNTVNTGVDALASNQGLCAVADVWGANPNVPPGPANPPDGEPEAIFISNGNLLILEGATGELINQRNLGGGQRGGAPNVDDFDGDGFLEIASALSAFYVVVDLQAPSAAGGACPAWPTLLPRAALADQLDNPNITAGELERNPGGAGAATLPSGAVVPGSCTTDADCDPAAVCNVQAERCVCLHNGWQRTSDDDSSRATSSSVFDFNGDGAAEVLYNDECEFRVFDGVTGSVLFADISRSRTWTENPVVADVDNDGNAEVVTVLNTERENRSCNDDPEGTILGPNGLRVWGDPSDTWVSARRIWNQQSYHVTNITESGVVPLRAPESWRAFNGLSYNTYRSQPRSFGVAPDLVVNAIGVFSPDAQCGTLSNVINVTFEIGNAGDLRVGSGVVVSLMGEWNGAESPLLDATGTPLQAVLPSGIEPGRSVISSTTFEVLNQPGSAPPDRVRVSVDSAGGAGGSGTTRECNEANNDLVELVEAGEPLPDLSLSVGAVTPVCAIGQISVAVTVRNSGAVAANGALLQLFAGDPTQGGSLLYEQRLDMPVPPLSALSLDVVVPGFPRNREITVFGAIDPNGEIPECNEGDNTDPADNAVRCQDLR